MKTSTLIGVGIAAGALILLFGRRAQSASPIRVAPTLTTGSNPAQQLGEGAGAFLNLTLSDVVSAAPAIQFGAGPSVVGTQPSPFRSW